jgi:hypothetical protein
MACCLFKENISTLKHKEREQLNALTGKLGSSFAAVAVLNRLQNELIGNQPEETRAETTAMIDAFLGAAARLKAQEDEFNNRPRDTSAAFNLKVNLRSTDHFTAIREFKSMAEDLVAIDPVAGQKLVKAVQNTIAAAPVRKAGA